MLEEIEQTWETETDLYLEWINRGPPKFIVEKLKRFENDSDREDAKKITLRMLQLSVCRKSMIELYLI